MLIEVDGSQMEWRTAVHLSGDKIGLQELQHNIDIHSVNQEYFKLPDRKFAKIFLFRAIYRGPAYAYANDPDYMVVSSSEKFWQGVIDKMYSKYYGLDAWHKKIIQEANRTGKYVAQTGRVYEFKRTKKGEYSIHDITNYPVQGLAAEFVSIARVTALRRYPKFYLKDRMLFTNTVHDSIVVDADVKEGSKELYDICVWLEDIYSDIPRNFERLFKSKVVVPLQGETKYGYKWSDMKKFDRSTYYE